MLRPVLARLVVSAAASFLLAAPVASAKPAVSVVSKSPLQLRGVGFPAAVVVKVAVTTNDGQILRRARTSSAGRFVARFEIAVDPCTGASAATITMRSGYRLALRLAPRGMCAPIQPID
jgi:hypothetical protein